jgi:hypothetical protein
VNWNEYGWPAEPSGTDSVVILPSLQALDQVHAGAANAAANPIVTAMT